MNRKRFIYFTDLILIPLFILSLYTGIKLHIAGHHANHEIWHNWTVFHTIASLLFLYSELYTSKAIGAGIKD
ncbi:DUF4405 domain-containing protein [Bacteroides nordii]|uniref:DUF4405 domain-containing protein n=1 Tax=Bacteroides nordii TaxID=291645 RepID=UPI002E1436F0